MERIDGFVDLDILLQKNIEELTKKGIVQDVSMSSKKLKFIIKFNNSQYYFKECSYQEAITELLVNEMLDKIGMPNIKYDLAYINGHYGVISNDFKKHGKKYIEGTDIIEEYITNLPEEIEKQDDNDFKQILEDEYEKFKSTYSAGYTKNNFELIWHAIESHFKNFNNRNEIVIRIMNQLCIVHILDILLLNEDRNKSNWVIEEDVNQASLVPMFDHGEAFKDEKWMALRVEPLSKKDSHTDIYIELKQFLDRSASSYHKVLIELKNKLRVEILNTAMNNVEEKIGVELDEEIKNKILKNYKIHIEKLDEVLSTYKTNEYEER